MSICIRNRHRDGREDLHSREVEIDWTQEGLYDASARLPATAIIFRRTQAEPDPPWHPAQRRQCIINLDADVELTTSDGQARAIGAGEINVVADTPGRGHLSRPVNSRMRHAIFVPNE
ncbi:hypothetical protein [Rhodopila sp.]|uniref:hypothetical protein n=1 Tax=Rhodopila sp. TaxID=2480087 RepID=UPI003D137BC4